MTPVASSVRAFPSRLTSRAANVAGAYLAAAVAILVVIMLLRGRIPPALLRSDLGFFFICSLASGLEPATAKAAVLGGKAEGALQDAARPFLIASAIKALAVSPVLAAVWRFSDAAAPAAACLWLPLVAVAGFAASDLRVLLDVEGRHATAIWLKQGTLVVGLIALAVLTLAGAPFFWAVGGSTLARLALLSLAPGMAAARRPQPRPWAAVRRLLADLRWMELAGASAVAAAGGSADRVLALRLLGPAAYNSYYLLYEVFSRFWLLPYLIGPILFARLAAGQETTRFISGAWRLTAAAGALFVAGVGALLLLAPIPIGKVLGAPQASAFAGSPIIGPGLVLFAVGIVLGAFAQLRIVELQGTGATRRAGAIIALGAVFSVLLFWFALARFGVPGLLMAWLVKGAVELAATFIGGERGLRRQ
ncbi:MAG: polysaccharide biosynthesis protein [Caulobacteraceae bacterium]